MSAEAAADAREAAAAEALAATDGALAAALAGGEVERAAALAAEREVLLARLAERPGPLSPAAALALRRALAGLPDLIALAERRRSAVAEELARLREGVARSRRVRAPDREAPRFVSERV